MAGKFFRRATRSASRVSVLALLGVLVVLVTAAYGVFAAGGKTDFSVSASPLGQTVTQGQATSFAVTVSPSGSFTGQVTLSRSAVPTGVTATFATNPLSITNSTQPVTTNLNITTSTSTPAGNYQIVVTGTGTVAGQSVSHTATVYLVVQQPPVADFSLSATPSSQTVSQGTQTQSTVAINRMNGFTAGVNLSVFGLPSGATASFSPANPNTTNSATMTVVVSSSTATGTYSLSIVGTSGSLTHSTGVTLTVQKPVNKSDFSLAASPASQTVLQGAQTSYTISITRTSFTAGVTLVASGLPTGATASFSPANPNTTDSATMTVTVPYNSPAGTYSVTVTGTSGSLIHSVGVTLVVQTSDFSVSATPSSQSVLQGDLTSYTVAISRANFTDGVTLSVTGLPSGATASYSPANPNTTNTATVTITTAATTPTGSYPLTITGTSGPRSHTTSVTLVVQQTVPFSINGDLPTPALYPGISPQPLNVSITNPYPFTLKVRSITVTVQTATSKTGCSGADNYAITPLSSSTYPLLIPANSTKKLSDLAIASTAWPKLAMRDLATNQDGCKGAAITLLYSGTADKQ